MEGKCPICGEGWERFPAWVRDPLSEVPMHPNCYQRLYDLRQAEDTCMDCGTWYSGAGLFCMACRERNPAFFGIEQGSPRDFTSRWDAAAQRLRLVEVGS